MWHVCRKEMHTGFWWGDLEEGVDGRTMGLKEIGWENVYGIIVVDGTEVTTRIAVSALAS